MDQLSLRDLDKELARKVRALARRERMSLTHAALVLMRRGAGLSDAASPVTEIGDGLDRFIGRWSVRDEKRLLQSIAACETVDKTLWK
jgi:hypothetical protein